MGTKDACEGLPGRTDWEMQLTVPDDVAGSLSPTEVALRLAIGLYVSEEATLGQAARIADLSQSEFLKELGARKIPFHYGLEEFREDLQVVKTLMAR